MTQPRSNLYFSRGASTTSRRYLQPKWYGAEKIHRILQVPRPKQRHDIASSIHCRDFGHSLMAPFDQSLQAFSCAWRRDKRAVPTRSDLSACEIFSEFVSRTPVRVGTRTFGAGSAPYHSEIASQVFFLPVQPAFLISNPAAAVCWAGIAPCLSVLVAVATALMVATAANAPANAPISAGMM